MTRTNELRIETYNVSELKPYANNPRTHSKKQIRQIADSIVEFGWTNPILVDGDGNVIEHQTQPTVDRAKGVSRLLTESCQFTARYGSGVQKHLRMLPKRPAKLEKTYCYQYFRRAGWAGRIRVSTTSFDAPELAAYFQRLTGRLPSQ